MSAEYAPRPLSPKRRCCDATLMLQDDTTPARRRAPMKPLAIGFQARASCRHFRFTTYLSPRVDASLPTARLVNAGRCLEKVVNALPLSQQEDGHGKILRDIITKHAIAIAFATRRDYTATGSG